MRPATMAVATVPARFHVSFRTTWRGRRTAPTSPRVMAAMAVGNSAAMAPITAWAAITGATCREYRTKRLPVATPMELGQSLGHRPGHERAAARGKRSHRDGGRARTGTRPLDHAPAARRLRAVSPTLMTCCRPPSLLQRARARAGAVPDRRPDRHDPSPPRAHRRVRATRRKQHRGVPGGDARARTPDRHDRGSGRLARRPERARSARLVTGARAFRGARVPRTSIAV